MTGFMFQMVREENWRQCYSIKANLSSPHINAMCIDAQGNIYAAINGNGIRKSSDEGNSWTDTGFSADIGVFSLTTNAAGYVYAGTKKGVFVLNNQTSSWNLILDSGGNIARSITVKNNIIYAAVDQIGLFKSVDNGISWTFSQLPQSWYTSILVISENEVYVSMHIPVPWFAQGIYKTNDGGQKWTKLTQGLSTDQIDVLALNTDNSILAAGILGRVFKTVNGGTNWTELSSCNTVNPITAVLPFGNKIIVGNNGAGMLFTENGGMTWKYSNQGFGKARIRNITKLNDGTLLIANSVGLFNYNPSTKEYTGMNEFIFDGNRNYFGDLVGMEFNGFVQTVSGTMLACTYQGAVFKLDESSKAWSQISIANKPSMIISFEKLSNGIFFTALGNKYGIFRSKDDGKTWESLGYDMDQCFSVAFDRSRNILYANMLCYLFYSTDGGASWDFKRHIFNESILDVKTSKSNDIYVLTNGTIQKSTDGGNSWKETLIDGCVRIYEIRDGYFMLATQKGIYESSDNGETWIIRNDNLKNSSIKLIRSVYGSTFAVTGDGTYSLDASENLAPVEQTKLPNSFSLMQNYPNPFNPTTKIGFNLPERSMAHLAIYDALGREVINLIHQEMNAGYHEVLFDGSNLASGIYLYRLTTPKNSTAKKLTLMK